MHSFWTLYSSKKDKDALKAPWITEKERNIRRYKLILLALLTKVHCQQCCSLYEISHSCWLHLWCWLEKEPGFTAQLVVPSASQCWLNPQLRLLWHRWRHCALLINRRNLYIESLLIFLLVRRATQIYTGTTCFFLFSFMFYGLVHWLYVYSL